MYRRVREEIKWGRMHVVLGWTSAHPGWRATDLMAATTRSYSKVVDDGLLGSLVVRFGQ